jgi:hypothetical protein
MQQDRWNKLAKQWINDDWGGGAKSVKQCWQDNNQSERKEKEKEKRVTNK